jgi:hypothetical protein
MLDTGFLASGAGKPENPKKCLMEAMRRAKLPRTSGIYTHVAAKVSLQNCSDPAFLKFSNKLREWFPQ